MDKYTGFEIAVIGMSGKFPKADNIHEYWERLKEGKDCISTFDLAEALEEGESEALLKNPAYVAARAFLDNKEYFDSNFFGYRPDEAELMDPQIRLYHECCWEALEDSGYNPGDYKNKIGLFSSGTSNLNWELYSLLKNNEKLVDDFTASHLREIGYLSSMVSYKFNLKGPSIFLQTACSSSLVAIHQACNSLLWGECSMALAGGVSISNYSRRGYVHQTGMIFSRDGKCRPFDVESSGTVGGEGAGVVVLKRLQDALRDRDHIYAVIKGTGINNDGNAKVGYTAPSAKGQAEAIRKAHRMAGVTTESISYIEAHGTGTELGDPIEIAALNEVFGKPAEGLAGSCAIGSAKSNIGHLDAAAGVAGFIKTVLSLKHKSLPASLHYNSANPRIDFASGPFYVNSAYRAWEGNGGPLRAGVSSFGIGGTNAHLVLEEAPVQQASGAGRDQHLLVLSAKNPSSLDEYCRRLSGYLADHKEVSMADLAYTLQQGRARFPYRKVLVCRDRQDALEQLGGAGKTAHGAEVSESLQHTVFMFPGQGSQYQGMCLGLYEQEKFFREQLEECLNLSAGYSGLDFRSALFGSDQQPDINRTEYAQPLLFIIEYSLARLLMFWGLRPDYMIGHSIGEYVAACISGVFSLPDALRLVIRRGELMGSVEEGRMLSVSMSAEALRALLPGHPGVELSVINSPSSVVVGGEKAAVDAFGHWLLQEGHSCKSLHTSHAFHSSMMSGIIAAFEQEVSRVEIHAPQIPYVSNVSGELLGYEELQQPGYWSTHLRQPVNFAGGASRLLQEGGALLLEVGAGRSLCNYMQENELLGSSHHLVNLVRQVGQQVPDAFYLTEKLGSLWLKGAVFNWDNYYADQSRGRIPLPGYCFEKLRYTTNVDSRKLLLDAVGAGHTAVNDGQDAVLHVSSWQRSDAPNRALELDQVQTYVILSDGDGFGLRLGAYLESQGQEVVYGDLVSMDHLFAELGSSGRIVQQVIYCAALSAELGEVNYGSLSGSLESGYLGLCRLGKCLSGLRQPEKVGVTVLGNHLARVVEGDQVNPLKSTLIGVVKVLPSEMHQISCKVIDLPYPFASLAEEESYQSRILNELFYETERAYVAYRYKERWTPVYQALKSDIRLHSAAEVKENGTYMVTGGFGGMGFTICRSLVKDHGAGVVLVHRSFFPAREDWDNWLASHDAEELNSQRIIQLRELESGGGRIDLYQVDVSSAEAVSDFSVLIKARYEHIDGLIWAAGEVDYGGIVINRKEEELLSYLSSKVDGVLLFEQYLDFDRMDFISLFSSVGNVFYQSKFGQVAYNAANEFMESYAVYGRTRFSGHVFTVSWCDWLNVGMTMKTLQRQYPAEEVTHLNEKIEKGIFPEEGLAAFYSCLSHKPSVFTVYKGNLEDAISSHGIAYRKRKASLGLVDRGSVLPDAVEGSMEDRLGLIFEHFFGKTGILSSDNFFELGGDSLKGMTLIGRINQEIGCQLTIGDLYRCADIGQLAAELETRQGVAVHIARSEDQDSYVLSSAQQRMYFLQQLDQDSILYNETELFWLNGAVDKQQLEATFRSLIRQHESLRTGFVIVDGEPRQMILSDFDFQLEHYQCPEGEVQSCIKNFVRPFELSEAPLYRVGIVECTAERHLMMIDLHHIISDGVSHGILIRDFMLLYQGKVLAAPGLRYRDYAEWQQGESQQLLISRQRLFWLNEFSGGIPVLELPADYSRPPERSYAGETAVFTIGPDQGKALKHLAEEEGASVFMFLLSVYNILLSKLSGQDNIVVGVPLAGRVHAELEDIVGMFVNVLPLRNNPLPGLSFREFLQEVKQRAVTCFDNQDYQLEELVEELKVARSANRNPLFDAVFVHRNYEHPETAQEGLKVEVYAHKQSPSRFDLTLWATELTEGMELSFEYSTELFSAGTIARFIGYFKNILTSVLNASDVPLADIEIVAKEEQEKVYGLLNGKVNRGAEFRHPSSYHQERLWFIDKFESDYLYQGGPVYHNIPLIIELEGRLNADVLEKNIFDIVQEHDILRTSIINEYEVPHQEVRKQVDFSLKQMKVSSPELAALMEREINIPFELDKLLLRAALLNYGEEKYILLLVFHHAIADRYSANAISEELLHRYASAEAGPKRRKNMPLVKYMDFSAWQKDSMLTLEPYFLSYWKMQLKGKLKALELPTDRPRKPVHTYTAGETGFKLSEDITRQLLAYSLMQDLAVGVLLMAAFKVLLQKYSKQEEVIIGTSIDNRDHEVLRNVIGPISNLIVLRSFMNEGMSFREYAGILNKTYQEGLKYGAMPFDKLVKHLAPAKDMSRTALFDVLYQYEDDVPATEAIKELKIKSQRNNYGYGKYDLNLLLFRDGDQIEGKLHFNLDYFNRSTADQFRAHYMELLKNLLHFPDTALSDIAMLDDAERDYLLGRFDNTSVCYPLGETVTGLFSKQVAATPDKIAIRFKGTSLTYAALDQRSTQIAHLLRNQGVVPDQVVGLLTDRSIDTITGMLGILKAGGCYLPIDIEYPAERRAYYIKDSGTSIVLTSRSLGVEVLDGVKVLFTEDSSMESELALSNVNQPSDLCYVIYTSGTTGNPKGVLVEHRNVVRLLFNEGGLFDFGADDVWTMFHSPCFDFSVWEIYGALLLGGTLIVIPKLTAMDTQSYLEVLKAEKVTVLNQTPSAFYSLMEQELKFSEKELCLRYVIFGGEALSVGKLKEWHHKYEEVKLINMYGITETTVHVTSKEITGHEISENINDIGFPIPTVSLYVLDSGMHAVAQGVIGELYVGGEGVSRGYLDRPSLNAEKFIADPYRDGGRLYRTGDLGRVTADGRIEYMGRGDQQVQLRGFRIELGEIESHLHGHEQISGTAVIATGSQEDLYLTAYYVSEELLDKADLKRYLSERLPDYMIPAYYVRLAIIPLTSNGKLNRAALPQPEHDKVEQHQGLMNETEEILAEIWSEILKIDKSVIGSESSFFDLGGHSLKATLLVNSIRKKFNIVISLKDVFEHHLIKQQSDYINLSDWLNSDSGSDQEIKVDIVI